MTKELQKTYKNTKLLMLCERDGKNIGIDKMHLYYDVIYEFISKDILDNYFKFCYYTLTLNIFKPYIYLKNYKH